MWASCFQEVRWQTFSYKQLSTQSGLLALALTHWKHKTDVAPQLGIFNSSITNTSHFLSCFIKYLIKKLLYKNNLLYDTRCMQGWIQIQNYADTKKIEFAGSFMSQKTTGLMDRLKLKGSRYEGLETWKLQAFLPSKNENFTCMNQSKFRWLIVIVLQISIKLSLRYHSKTEITSNC